MNFFLTIETLPGAVSERVLWRTRSAEPPSSPAHAYFEHRVREVTQILPRARAISCDLVRSPVTSRRNSSYTMSILHPPTIFRRAKSAAIPDDPPRVRRPKVTSKLRWQAGLYTLNPACSGMSSDRHPANPHPKPTSHTPSTPVLMP